MATKSINLTVEEQKAILAGNLPASVVKKVTTATKPKSVKYGRAKGMRGQHWVANRFASILNIDWEQADDNSPIAVRPSGQHGSDIILRGEAYNRLPFDVECKWAESFNFVDTIEQTAANTKAGRIPLIVHNRKAFKEPIVILNWSDFESILLKIIL